MIAELLALALAAAPAVAGAPTATDERPAGFTARGRVRSAGERTPVAGAKVYAVARRGGWTREAVTGPDGGFALVDLPERDFALTVVATGHERLEQSTRARDWRRPLQIYVRPLGVRPYRTLVTQERAARANVYSAQLSPEEIATLPGSQGDPLRALQNLPGAARIPGGLGLIVMRGATPNQSQVFYGEHPIPRAFHVPGLASVVSPGALAGIQYIPGNFDSSRGNAVGGVVLLTPKIGRRDGVHGHARLDVISVGALVEGPMRRGSFLIAAQRGYLDTIVKALGEEVLGPNYIRPRYYDYQIVFDHPVGPGATVTTRILGARDELRYPSRFFGGGEVALTSEFHRFDVAYRKRHGAWDFLLAPAVRLDRAVFASADFYRRRGDVVGLFRGELSVRASRRLHLTAGVDAQLDRHVTRVSTAMREDIGRPAADTRERGFLSTSGVYVTSAISLGRLTFSPGLRVSLFTGEASQRAAVDPRLVARFAAHPRVALTLGAGLYSQPSQLRFAASSALLTSGAGGAVGLFGIDTLVLPGAVAYLDARLELDARSRVGVSQAAHLSGNVHVDLPAALGLDVTAFYRRVNDGLPPTADGPLGPVVMPDTGSQTYGVEAMLRRELTRRVHGWIAYTWMRSQRGDFTSAGLELRSPADFDQRHNLVAVISVRLPRRWEIGGRFRVVTGLPFTPYVGGVHSDGPWSLTNPIAGGPNSARMPAFHQLDLRVDRTWVLRRSVVSAYLDVQNIYNRQNPEGVLYSEDYSTTRTVVGVPILPVLGVRVGY